MKIDDILTKLVGVNTFDLDPTKDPLKPKIETDLRDTLVKMLTEAKNTPVEGFMEAKKAHDTHIKVLKHRIEYLEDFIVRLARSTEDI